MNIQLYKEICEKFFQENHLDAEGNVEAMIAHLTPIKFSKWQTEVFQKYDTVYQPIRNIIQEVRKKHHFDISNPNVDWENDPIKTQEMQNFLKEYKDIYDSTIQKYLENNLIYQKKCEELKQYFAYENEQKKLELEYNGKKIKAEKVIDVLWAGWECDDKVWLIKEDNKKKIIATNHGSPYIADANFLKEKLKEYQKAIQETEELLKELENN